VPFNIKIWFKYKISNTYRITEQNKNMICHLQPTKPSILKKRLLTNIFSSWKVLIPCENWLENGAAKL
jgi:hypothetical protein